MKVEEDEKLKKRKERFGAQTAASSVGGAEVEVVSSPGLTSINHLLFDTLSTTIDSDCYFLFFRQRK